MNVLVKKRYSVFLLLAFYGNFLQSYSWFHKIPFVIVVNTDKHNDSLFNKTLESVISLCFGTYVMHVGCVGFSKERYVVDKLPYIALVCAGCLMTSRGVVSCKEVMNKLTAVQKRYLN